MASLILISNAYSNCFEEAGFKLGLNPKLLYAVAKVESGINPYVVNKNKDGSEDIGVMQINSFWIKKLNLERDFLFEPCINVLIGGWILKNCIDKFGYSLKALDCYNKGPTKAKNKSIYAEKILKELKRIQ